MEILTPTGAVTGGTIEASPIFALRDGVLAATGGYPQRTAKFSNAGLDPAVVLEVIQGGGVVATADLSNAVQSALIRPFGEEGQVAVTSTQLLFVLPAAQAAAADRTASG